MCCAQCRIDCGVDPDGDKGAEEPACCRALSLKLFDQSCRFGRG